MFGLWILRSFPAETVEIQLALRLFSPSSSEGDTLYYELRLKLDSIMIC